MFRIALDEAGRLNFTRSQGSTEPLLPRHGMTFGFADTELIRVEFRRKAAGAVDVWCSTNRPASNETPRQKQDADDRRCERIDELKGFRVGFYLGPDEQMNELLFQQPNGTFLARRT